MLLSCLFACLLNLVYMYSTVHMQCPFLVCLLIYLIWWICTVHYICSAHFLFVCLFTQSGVQLYFLSLWQNNKIWNNFTVFVYLSLKYRMIPSQKSDPKLLKGPHYSFFGHREKANSIYSGVFRLNMETFIIQCIGLVVSRFNVKSWIWI